MMLTEEQVAFYNEHGWLRIPQIFTGEEFRELAEDTESLIQAWTQEVMGWTGPWRKVYMDADTEARSKLVVLFEFNCFQQLGRALWRSLHSQKPSHNCWTRPTSNCSRRPCMPNRPVPDNHFLSIRTIRSTRTPTIDLSMFWSTWITRQT